MKKMTVETDLGLPAQIPACSLPASGFSERLASAKDLAIFVAIPLGAVGLVLSSPAAGPAPIHFSMGSMPHVWRATSAAALLRRPLDRVVSSASNSAEDFVGLNRVAPQAPGKKNRRALR